MSLTFSTYIQLPSCKSKIKVKQLYFEDYMHLQKFLQNNNDDEIQQFIDSLIEKYTEGVKFHELSAIDKFCILLHMRCISYSSSVKFTTKDKAVVDFKVVSLINSILDIKAELCTKIIPGHPLEVCLRLPRKFHYTSDIEFYYDCISALRVNGIEQPMYENLERLLPASLFVQIKEFVGVYESRFNEICLELPKHVFPEKVTLSLRNTDLIEILKFCLRENMQNFYEKIYQLVSKKGFSIQDLQHITPGEVDIMFNHFRNEAEMQVAPETNQTISSIVKDITSKPKVS